MPRRFQFSLRTLLFVMAVISVLLGYWSYKARQQRAAVVALQRSHAFVRYDNGLTRTCGEYASPRWPPWLLDRVGVDYFGNVIEVACFVPPSEMEMKHLERLTGLRELSFANANTTDAHLKCLENMADLRVLRCNNTPVTDAGLGHVKHLKSLEILQLDNTQVTDTGLENLRGLCALKILSLFNTKVTDVGVARLKQALPDCVVARRPDH